MAKICAELLFNTLIVSTGTTVSILREGTNGRAQPFILKIPDVPAKVVSKNSDKPGKETHDNSQVILSKDIRCHILCLRGCKCGRHVAVSNSRKQLAVIKLPQLQNDDINGTKIVLSVVLQRNALCLTFVDDCNRILVADKSGDVFAYDLISGNQTLLFGHLAIILDIVISADNKHVITCDRDEKIKTTCYPNTYNVQAFCLGHTEYVISIGFTSHNADILYSASGDGTIRLWTYKDGKCLHIIDCKEYLPAEMVSLCAEMQSSFRPSGTRQDSANALTTSRTSSERLIVPIKKATISKLDLIAVIFHRLHLISLYKVISNADNTTCTHHLQNILLTPEPFDVCFDKEGNLFVACTNGEKTPSITGYMFHDNRFLPFSEESKAACLLKNVPEVWPSLNVLPDVPSIIPTLFKQWFDNVSDYYEMKEKRSNQHADTITPASQNTNKKRLKMV